MPGGVSKTTWGSRFPTTTRRSSTPTPRSSCTSTSTSITRRRNAGTFGAGSARPSRRGPGTDELRFGAPDGLTPLLGSDRGETVFLARDSAGKPLIFAENGEEEFFCQAIPFSEWLRQYVSGDDAVGPGSGILHPGPVKFRSLPMTPQDTESVWFGPERSG